jgi:hypothetical protein
MTAAETLARITSIASELVFQPESDHAIVQVMGPLEAAGLHFDALWVSGVSNRNWPPPGRPLSLLSRDLQRDAGMPDASPDDTLAYAERVLTRLVSSATRVVLSYPATQDDVQQSASELLQGLSKAETPATPDPGWHARQQCSAATVTCMALDRVPAIGAEEIVAGGAATIQRQLQDPFAAFVTGRLGVRTLWPFVAGLPASLRGSLIHAALHRLYAECPAGEQIRSWDGSEIASRCKLAVQFAFRSQERHADVVLRILLQLEKMRVNALLAGVVALDANRDDFKIHCVEQKFAASIAGVQLRLRVDRIDLDGNGEVRIIDYKTGAARQLLDRNKNPKDMQLLVYTLAVSEPVSGVALYNIDSRAIDMLAVGREHPPGRDWDSALADWQGQVEAAALQLAAGDVRVSRQQTLQSARPFALLSRYQELLHDR